MYTGFEEEAEEEEKEDLMLVREICELKLLLPFRDIFEAFRNSALAKFHQKVSVAICTCRIIGSRSAFSTHTA
jgi:hypothetical protein